MRMHLPAKASSIATTVVRAVVLSGCIVAGLGWSTPVHAADLRAPGTDFRDCPDCPEMVVVPAGAFLMGTPGESLPGATVVKVPRPFALGRREVTRGEYAKFIADTAYEPKPGCRSFDVGSGRVLFDRTRTWQNPLVPALPQETHPVTCLSQADAAAYAQWLARKTGKSYRLPSEAEWEYAARAGSAARYSWGDDLAFACGEANVYDLGAEDLLHLGTAPAPCRDGQTDIATAGRYHANAYGLQDLIGNVAEWTQDCVTDSYVGRPEDTRPWVWVGGCTQRVVRGGSWRSPVRALGVAARTGVDADERNDALGFRVALELDK